MSYSLYLTFNGNCEEAVNFYKEKLNGQVHMIQRFGDSPMPVAEDEKNLIMHASMDIQGSTLMFSDSVHKNNVTIGNNFSISLNFNNEAEIERVFTELSAGGQVTMPLQEVFWAPKFGMCTDKFGINWMFSLEHK